MDFYTEGWWKDYQGEILVGVDEVGRGSVAGPVSLGFVGIWRKDLESVWGEISLVVESKKLSAKKREEWCRLINKYEDEGKIICKVVSRGPRVIDEIGLSGAIAQCIDEGVSEYVEHTPYVFLDGLLKVRQGNVRWEEIKRGDELNPLIALASILAKVERDGYMVLKDSEYRGYGFSRNKGYGTKEHYLGIEKLGLCELHRKSWFKGKI